MKNKKLIIVIAAALVVVIATVVLILTLGGSKLSKCEKMIEKSAQSVVEITTNVVVSDKEQEVYKYLESVKITDANGEVMKQTSKLNPSYEFSTTEENSFVENIDRKALLNFNFDKSYFVESAYKNSVLNLTVKADSIAKFLGGSDIACEENASAVFTFNGKKLAQAEITFTLMSGKKVLMTVLCNY